MTTQAPVIPERQDGALSRARSTVGAYVALTKPRIIELLLITTLPTMVVVHAIKMPQNRSQRRKTNPKRSGMLRVKKSQSAGENPSVTAAKIARATPRPTHKAVR